MIFQFCFSVLLSIVIANNVNAHTYSCGGNNICVGAQTVLDNEGYTDEGGLQCGSALSESGCNTLRGNLGAMGGDRSDSATAPGCVHNGNWIYWQTAGTADCGTGNYACVCDETMIPKGGDDCDSKYGPGGSVGSWYTTAECDIAEAAAAANTCNEITGNGYIGLSETECDDLVKTHTTFTVGSGVTKTISNANAGTSTGVATDMANTNDDFPGGCFIFHMSGDTGTHITVYWKDPVGAVYQTGATAIRAMCSAGGPWYTQCLCDIAPNTDCAGTWACNADCVREFTETVAQSGTGATCPVDPEPTNCQPSVGSCPATATCVVNTAANAATGACPTAACSTRAATNAACIAPYEDGNSVACCTFRVPSLCLINQYVSSGTCTACPAGSTNAAGDNANGGVDTSCDPTLCAENEYVLNNVCTACAAGETRPAGDDASGANTICSIIDEFLIPKGGNDCESRYGPTGGNNYYTASECDIAESAAAANTCDAITGSGYSGLTQAECDNVVKTRTTFTTIGVTKTISNANAGTSAGVASVITPNTNDDFPGGCFIFHMSADAGTHVTVYWKDPVGAAYQTGETATRAMCSAGGNWYVQCLCESAPPADVYYVTVGKDRSNIAGLEDGIIISQGANLDSDVAYVQGTECTGNNNVMTEPECSAFATSLDNNGVLASGGYSTASPGNNAWSWFPSGCILVQVSTEANEASPEFEVVWNDVATNGNTGLCDNVNAGDRACVCKASEHTCTCPYGGTAATGAACTISGETCGSCYAGFTLESGSCKPSTTYVIVGQEPNSAQGGWNNYALEDVSDVAMIPGTTCPTGYNSVNIQADCVVFKDLIVAAGQLYEYSDTFSTASYPPGCGLAPNANAGNTLHEVIWNDVNVGTADCDDSSQRCVCKQAAVDCVGTFSPATCAADCNARTFTQTTAASSGGQTCTQVYGVENGGTVACANGDGACVLCGANEHVSGGVCAACAAGTNAAGDNPANGATVCDVNCDGTFSPATCQADCGARTFTQTVAQSGSGNDCATVFGEAGLVDQGTVACGAGEGACAAVNCVGAFGDCDADCIKTFSISVNELAGGNACAHADGYTEACTAVQGSCTQCILNKVEMQANNYQSCYRL